MRNQNKCFWADEETPRGKYYEVGDRVPEASEPGMCRMACVCTEGYGGGAEIICASPGKKNKYFFFLFENLILHITR